MQHWSQLATRNWRARPVRTLGAVAAIALGTGAVVWVTCSFESVRSSIMEWATQYVGAAHINLEASLGRTNQIPARFADIVADVPGVAHTAAVLVLRERGLAVERELLPSARQLPANDGVWLDFFGIEIEREQRIRTWNITAGRMLDERDQVDPQTLRPLHCVLERGYAEERGIEVGDAVLIWGPRRGEPYTLEVVGLVERRRIARFQQGMVLLPLEALQRIAGKELSVTSIDVVVEDATEAGIVAVQREIIKTLNNERFGRNVNVRNTTARMRQIERAQSQQELVLALLSSVGMLTALFIILSTLSMGMIERISQLGLMRCVGVTGRQLSLLVLAEVVPLGLGGVIAGVPIGLGLARLSVWLAPEYVGTFTISMRGISLAVLAGLVTTLVAAMLPMFAALGVSPLEATRPRAARPRRWLVLVVFVVGLLLLAAQYVVLENWAYRSPRFVYPATLAIVLLYLAYACAAPLIVWLIGTPAVVVVARLLRLRTRLLQDQVGHAVWRSTGICCGLMVGLSLIVGLVVFSESFRSGWQFPKQFPAAFIWSEQQLRPYHNDVDEIVAEVEGVGSFTTCNAANVTVLERPAFLEQLYASMTWFMGINPQEFFKLVKAEFVEGDEASAIAMLEAGDHIVIADDFARTRDKHLGDVVKVYFANKAYHFKVAGVVTSPALDIAANYFQLNSEMMVAASGSVIGTNADMERLFQVRGRRIVLINFEAGFPPEPVPAGWPPAPDEWESKAVHPDDFYWDTVIPLEQRWAGFRQRELLRTVCVELGAPNANYGTVAELKNEIDANLTRVTRLLAAVPTVALLVAALGVANLMGANVASRTNQLAILRAVGATRGLVLRLVIGEAIVLGLIGSGLGIGLGLHLAANTTTLTERMWGFAIALQLPWGLLIAAISLTVGLCLIAGLLPARAAARTNVVDALRKA